MSIDAIALLKIPYKILDESFRPFELQVDDNILCNLSCKQFVSIIGTPFCISKAEDATCICTYINFYSKPLQISQTIRMLLGKALDNHCDDQGIFIFPDTQKPKNRTYEAIIDELKEYGFWAPIVPITKCRVSSLCEIPSDPFQGKNFYDLLDKIPVNIINEMTSAMLNGDEKTLEKFKLNIEKLYKEHSLKQIDNK